MCSSDLLMQFQPLVVGFTGRNDLRILTSAEWAGGHLAPMGDGLLCAFYLNELLMRLLARDVGSLQRLLGNVKTRGVFGEVQLAALLEQVFTPEQYAANVETVPGSGARVEFALRLPGRGDEGRPLWLPIDAKFPREDYERLLAAQDAADPVAAEAAAKAIETRLRAEARTIRDKYIAAPHTTDFGILFVPTEIGRAHV